MRRIDANYCRTADAPVRLKRWLSFFAALAGLGYAGYVVFASVARDESAQLSPGDLAQVHSTWNASECQKCHTPHIPIRADALWGNDPKHIQLNNQKCDTCHPTAGHFAARTQAAVRDAESCNTCHREHLGMEHDLLQIEDGQCVRCHENLAKIANADPPRPREQVTRFEKSAHPEFRSLQSDPGNIAFSHAQHLRPGQPRASGDRTGMTLDRIPINYRAQFASKVDATTGLLQLDCTDCHQPDSSWSGSSGQSPPMATAESNHRFFKPIEFDRHCAACHQMPYGVAHGLNRIATFESLQKNVAYEWLKKVPGPDALVKIRQEIGRATAILNNHEGCLKCHLPASQDDQQLVLPAQIPQRWLEGADFRHGAHARVACHVCHFQPAGDISERIDSRGEAKRVMIAGLESCAKCHISQSEQRAEIHTSGDASQVASGQCIECHKYHVDKPAKNSVSLVPRDSQFNFSSSGERARATVTSTEASREVSRPTERSILVGAVAP